MVKLTNFDKRMSETINKATINDDDLQRANIQVLDIIDIWKNDAPQVLVKWKRPSAPLDQLNLQIAARTSADLPFHRHIVKLNKLAEIITQKEKQLAAVKDMFADDSDLHAEGAKAAYNRWSFERKIEKLEKEIRSANEQFLKQHQKLLLDRQLIVVNLLRNKALSSKERVNLYMGYVERMLNEKIKILSHAPKLYKSDIDLAKKMLEELNETKLNGEIILKNNKIRTFTQQLVALTKLGSLRPVKKSTLFFLHKRLAACANALNEALGRESLLNIKAIKKQKDVLKKATPAEQKHQSVVELQSAIKKAKKMQDYYKKQSQFLTADKDIMLNNKLEEKWKQVRKGLEKILLDNIDTRQNVTAINTKKAMEDLDNFAFNKKGNVLSATDPKLSVDEMKRIRGAIRSLQASLDKDVKSNLSYSLLPDGMQIPSETSFAKQLRKIEKMHQLYLLALPDGKTKTQVNELINAYTARLKDYASRVVDHEKGRLPEQQAMLKKPAINGMGEVTPEAKAAHDQMLMTSFQALGEIENALKTEKSVLDRMKQHVEALASVSPTGAWVVTYQKLKSPADDMQRESMEKQLEGDITRVLSVYNLGTGNSIQQRRASSAMFSGQRPNSDDFVGPQPSVPDPSNRHTR